MSAPEGDPGLAAQRTTRARERTLLALGAYGLLAVQHLLQVVPPPVLTGGVAVAGIASVGSVVARSRLPHHESSAIHLILLAVTVSSAALATTIGLLLRP